MAEMEMVDLTQVEDPKIVYPKGALFKQVLAAMAVSLGSLVVGFSAAYTATALVSMLNEESTLHVTARQASWVAILMPLSALAGGIIGGPLIETIGRRNTIILTGPPFILAYLLINFANHIAMVMAGRSLTGLSVGIASLALPVYLGETVEARVRGTLGLLPTSLGNLGILLCYTTGTYLDWRYLALLGAFLPVPFLVSTFLIPESPLSHISRGNEKEAEKSLQWLRGKNADVSKELRIIVESHKDLDNTDLKETITQLFSKQNLKPFLICCALMFFQQFSGMYAVNVYTGYIRGYDGSSIDSYLYTIIVGVVNLVSTLVATLLIDRLGRKILLYISYSLMALSQGVLAVYFFFNSKYNLEAYTGILLPTSIVFTFAFSIGAGPISWLMMGEILPAKIRGAAASIVTSLNWTGMLIVANTLFVISTHLGVHSAFMMFCVICLIGIVFVVRYVPETQGKTLEEIEEQLTGRFINFGSIRSRKATSML